MAKSRVFRFLVDHLAQELNVRLLSQENHFLGQYLVPAKLNAFNSRLQEKIYETYKTYLSKKRDFYNENLTWQTKWSHSTDEKPVTLTESLQHATQFRSSLSSTEISDMFATNVLLVR